MAVLLTKHPIVAQYDLSSVHTVTSGAAPLSKETAQQLMTKLHINCIRQGNIYVSFLYFTGLMPGHTFVGGHKLKH